MQKVFANVLRNPSLLGYLEQTVESRHVLRSAVEDLGQNGDCVGIEHQTLTRHRQESQTYIQNSRD